MGNLVYLFSCFLSCTVIVSLMSQFWNDRYEKTFENPVIYKIVTVAAIAVLTLVNLINSVVWNGIATVLVFGIIQFFFYMKATGNGEGCWKANVLLDNRSV